MGEVRIDRVRPIGVEQERSGGAVGKGEGRTHGPFPRGHACVQPGVRSLEHGAGLADTVGIAVGFKAHAIEHHFLLWRGNVVVEEAVQHPHLERLVAILGDQRHRTGMVQVEVFDDAGRFDHRAVAVDQYRETSHRPQRRQLGIGLRVLQAAVVEQGIVLVQRNQRFLAVRREGVGVQAQAVGGHGSHSLRRWESMSLRK